MHHHSSGDIWTLLFFLSPIHSLTSRRQPPNDMMSASLNHTCTPEYQGIRSSSPPGQEKYRQCTSRGVHSRSGGGGGGVHFVAWSALWGVLKCAWLGQQKIKHSFSSCTVSWKIQNTLVIYPRKEGCYFFVKARQKTSHNREIINSFSDEGGHTQKRQARQWEVK